MASNPGLLTDWPWTPLGNFKYVVLAPWAIHSVYSFMVKDERSRDLVNFLILPFMLMRILHSQFWISFSRHRTAKGNNRIVEKPIDFDQVDRERNWDDQIIFNGVLFYLGNRYLPGSSHLPLWRWDGIILTILLHAGPVEFIYYWFHRALHHHFLYSRYHSHHHSSIVTEPITSVVHPFAEHIAYFMLFAIPLLTCSFTGTASIASIAGYLIFIDFMNNMGHCNFELIPKRFFSLFPPLKYLIYTSTYHSLHHTQFRTNYSLFMPMYDYLYGTTDKSTDNLYKSSLQRQEDSPDVVHLTHLTTLESVYHIRLGFRSLASRPQSSSKWYIRIMFPLTLCTTLVTRIYGRTFVVERNVFKNLKLQTWSLPKFTLHYFMKWQREGINRFIEEAILEADGKGTKVFSLGLMNQGEDLNENGEVYIKRNPNLKVKVVDGSSLAVAIVLNNIPKGTTQVILRGNLTKVARGIAMALCQRGIKVTTLYKDEYEKLKKMFQTNPHIDNLAHLADSWDDKIWLVGEGLREEEQMKAPKGTIFIPFSGFPPNKHRKDCFYFPTPSLLVPNHLHNLDSCENWLPRRVMSAWRVAGIVHALEGWNEHECGDTMLDYDKVWEAALLHGFQPFTSVIPY
ncbi:very-long-chain aldehyde decarbonylase CER1-like [Impatiens glandulifera]|uniref:very-long-chain aldehyde decarbonylase CER1-like n=1 Tax=Impatiens glandulifera TaxID=253017 RepID=UPI001FB158F4|nr:very-long-chain aldehyde decarbonylase CER1-like [Impatiens glandulifera]